MVAYNRLNLIILNRLGHIDTEGLLRLVEKALRLLIKVSRNHQQPLVFGDAEIYDVFV